MRMHLFEGNHQLVGNECQRFQAEGAVALNVMIIESFIQLFHYHKRILF
jgi:hypothetical protein